jgi:hypothetical protein
VRLRRLLGSVGRPLNFTVRRPSQMSDRDAQLIPILRIGRDVSLRGGGVSIRDALKRVSYVGYRATFKAKDLLPLIAADPSLIEEWLAYSEDKRTSGGWYILRSGELGQVSRPASRITYSTIEEAVAEFVVRELDYWMEPDEFPPGWNKTLSVLIAELTESRRPIGPPETEWARAYERSLLRPWARFPVDGEVYETLEDTPIKFLTHWRAPFTDGGEGTLPKGTQVRVKIPDWIREPIGVSADPLDVPRIERLLVSEDDRKNAKYGGFSLSISTAELNRRFRLVEGTPDEG